MTKTTAPSGFYLRVFSLCATIAAICYFSMIVFRPLAQGDFFVYNKQTGIGCSDFVALYGAGILSRSPEHLNIYNQPTQLKIENQLIAPYVLTESVQMQYPPWFFTMMVPISLVAIKPAFVVWSIVCPLLGSASLYLLLTTGPLKSKLDRSIFIAFVLASAPMVNEVRLGQTSAWFFTCACCFFYAWRKEAFKQAALFLALSTFKLQATLFFFIPLIAQKKWRAMAWALLFQLLLILVAFLHFGWRAFIEYPYFLWRVETSGAMSVAPKSMDNLRALLLNYLPTEWALVGSLTAFLLSLLYLFSVWRRAGRGRMPSDGWPIALTCVFAVLTSPHTHFHMCILLAIAAAVTLKSISLMDAVRDKSKAYNCWALLLIFYWPLTWLYWTELEHIPGLLVALLNLLIAIVAIINTELNLQSQDGESAFLS